MDKKIPPLASKQLEPLLTPISDIKPHPDNYKIHTPEQIKDLRASLKAFGCTQPIKVNLEGFIVAGHGMYQLYMEDGYTDVPVMFEALDKKLSKAYLVADNETARKAQTDQDQLGKLLEEIGEIPDFDIEATGFDLNELDNLLEFSEEPTSFRNNQTGSYQNNSSFNNPPLNSNNLNNKSKFSEAPTEFKEFDENIETTYKCPKCGYEY